MDAKTPLSDIMESAYRAHGLVPAFNIAHLPMLKPVVETLKELNSFGLIEVSRPDVEKFGAKSFSAVAEEFKNQADPAYCRLHLDHIPVIDEDLKPVDWEPLIRKCLDLGFHSVMIDGSRLPLDENIAATRKVVEMANEYSVPTEAELGAVLGHEAGPLPPYDELFESGKGFTRPDEARRFVEETGVSWLSVAVGNIHGAISAATRDTKKVAARLNIDHLKTLSAAVNRPLVLHGGSGVQRSYLLEAIQNGITKINIATDIRQAYERGLKDSDGDVPAAQTACAVEVRRFVI